MSQPAYIQISHQHVTVHEIEPTANKTPDEIAQLLRNGNATIVSKTNLIQDDNFNVLATINRTENYLGPERVEATAYFNRDLLGTGYSYQALDGTLTPLEEHLQTRTTREAYAIFEEAVDEQMNALRGQSWIGSVDKLPLLKEMLLLKLVIAARWGSFHWKDDRFPLPSLVIERIFTAVATRTNNPAWYNDLDSVYLYRKEVAKLSRHYLPYYNLIDDYFAAQNPSTKLTFTDVALESLLAAPGIGDFANIIFFEERYNNVDNPPVDISGGDVCQTPSHQDEGQQSTNPSSVTY